MNYDYPQSFFSKSILAGVFAGLAATLVNLAYNYFYRAAVQFYPSEIINVSTIIFVTMLLLTVCGLLYFFLTKLTKFANGIYIIIFGILAIYCFYIGLHINRSDNPIEISQFRGLYLGIEGLTGALAVFGIPYLVKHSNIYI